jgi:hypothetical protein
VQSNGTVHAALLCVLCLTGPVLHRACCLMKPVITGLQKLAGVFHFWW